MNWKKPSSNFLVYAGVQLAILALSSWKSYPRFRLYDFKSHEFIECALGIVAINLGMAGRKILSDCAPRKVRSFLFFWILVLFLALLELIARGERADGLFYTVLVLLAVPFPVALYLNRKQSKSPSQSTIANVS